MKAFQKVVNFKIYELSSKFIDYEFYKNQSVCISAIPEYKNPVNSLHTSTCMFSM